MAGLIACEQREELQAQLKAAFEQWYEFKDIHGREARMQQALVTNATGWRKIAITLTRGVWE